MSNRVRGLVVVLAAMTLDGCASQPENTSEPAATSPDTSGLAISVNTQDSLIGSFAKDGQQISFAATPDGACQTMNMRGTSGEPLVHMALCPDGDALDIGGVFHAVGPSGSVLSTAILSSAQTSAHDLAVAKLLIDPAFSVLPDLSAQLGGPPAPEPGARSGEGFDWCWDGFVACGALGAALPPPSSYIVIGVCAVAFVACLATPLIP